ncbi:MAG TPA: hypothetical protein VIF09_27725 [Polyangiaceae bacterium]
MDASHTIRGRILALVFAVVVVAGCKSQARKDHEALGASMRSAVDSLCDSYMRVEGGGCVTVECHHKRDAGYGHAAVVASRGLASVPTFSDPKTEAALSTVRAAAQRVLDAYGVACGDVRVDWNDFRPSPEVTRCADARNAVSLVGGLVDAVAALAADVKTRTGAEIPSTSSCPP